MPAVTRDDHDGGIAVLTLDDPARLNPLSRAMVADLGRAIAEVEQDRSLRAVVITGAGRGFCSGADLDVAADPAYDAGRNPVGVVLDSQDRIAEINRRLHNLPVPVVAAVNGPAAGGGFTLALACDFRIAAQRAKFVASFIKHGVSGADMGSSYFLPRLVGPSKALEILLTARYVPADEALRIGLVSDVVPDDEVLDASIAFARTLVQHSPVATWMTKQTLWHNVDESSLERAMQVENRTQVMCYGSGEMERAAAAFVTGVPVTDWLPR